MKAKTAIFASTLVLAIAAFVGVSVYALTGSTPVNVAFANELAVHLGQLGVDVWEVVDAAATKPFGFMPFYPGPGCGGNGIPIVPFFLSWKLKTLGTVARFIELSGEVNDAMPASTVTRPASILAVAALIVT